MKMDLITGSDVSLVSMTVRLILAAVLGGLVGADRESSGQAAGVRTFSLVCLGSCLAMLTGEYLFTIYPKTDPSRIAAQVISGIGFLGVGTIVVTARRNVKGLTTAATLWVTAALGIAIGAGLIWESLICFVLIMVVVFILTPVSRYMDRTNRRVVVYLELDYGEGIVDFFNFIRERGYSVHSMEKMTSASILKDDISMRMVVDMKKRRDHTAFIKEIRELPYIHYVEESK